jgi:hypothetical protein
MKERFVARIRETGEFLEADFSGMIGAPGFSPGIIRYDRKRRKADGEASRGSGKTHDRERRPETGCGEGRGLR